MYNLNPIGFLEMVAAKRYAMTSVEGAGVHWNATPAANVGVVHFDGVEGVVKNAIISDIRGQSVITGDTCLVRCANTLSDALGKLTLRDATLTGLDATGCLVHQTTTGRVTKVLLDNCEQTLGESSVILDNTTNPAIVSTVATV